MMKKSNSSLIKRLRNKVTAGHRNPTDKNYQVDTRRPPLSPTRDISPIPSIQRIQSTESDYLSDNTMSSHKGEDAMAAADKEMEERANRAKELLSTRYRGMKHEQVSIGCSLRSNESF